jgi:hypothetical protein
MIYIALYRGKSIWPSRMIEWFSWSVYSHASLARRMEDGHWRNIEAWAGAVRETAGLLVGHDPKTPVDLFRFVNPLTYLETEMLWDAAQQEIGKPYDYRGVLSFVLRRRMQRPGAWFCSELVAAKCAAISRPLFTCEPWRVAPGMIADSTVLEKAFSL